MYCETEFFPIIFMSLLFYYCKYIIFYAVSNKGLGGKTARELLHNLFDLAQAKNAAILAETSIARNMVIYKRYGFETYNQQQFESFPVFYMRRPPVQKD